MDAPGVDILQVSLTVDAGGEMVLSRLFFLGRFMLDPPPRRHSKCGDDRRPPPVTPVTILQLIRQVGVDHR